MTKRIFPLIILLLVSACSVISPGLEIKRAEQAAVDFFGYLASSDYANADELFGGDYWLLEYFNPQIDPTNHVALWKSACEVNGLLCVPILRVLKTEKFSLNEFFLTVEFEDTDGKVFVLGPCCGADESEMPPQSQFEIHVIERDRKYLVTSLPVYVP